MSRRELWKAISERKSKFSSILTTHLMEEADKLCDRIAIMCGGRIVALGSSSFLKHKYGTSYRLVIQLEKSLVDGSLIIIFTTFYKIHRLFIYVR